MSQQKCVKKHLIIVNDENKPPPLLPSATQQSLALGMNTIGLRPKRKTRQCFRDLTNNEAVFTPKARSRKRRAPAKKRSGIAMKKAKVQAVSLFPPLLEKMEPTGENVGASDGGDDEDKMPPILERMVEATAVEMEEGELGDDDDSESKTLVASSPESPTQSTPPSDSMAVTIPLDLVTRDGLRTSPSPPKTTSPRPSTGGTRSRPTTPPTTSDSIALPKKKKKAKGRNGNIYIGVANRILWLQLQEKFGFDNINSFGNFIMGYMNKVHEDFEILHQVAVDVGLFEAQGLRGFRWMNGLPHPVNAAGEFITLPEIQMTEEYCKRAFDVAYDLCIKRGKFLVELANGSIAAQGEQDNGDDVGETSSPEVLSGTEGMGNTSPVMGEDALEEDLRGELIRRDDVEKVMMKLIRLTEEIERMDQEDKVKDKDVTEESEIGNSSKQEEGGGTTDQNQDVSNVADQCAENSSNSPTTNSTTGSQSSQNEEALTTGITTPEEVCQTHTTLSSPEQNQTSSESEPEEEALQLPMMVTLELDLNLDEMVEDEANKENVNPDPSTPAPPDFSTSTTPISSAFKRTALRQILGDISLESVTSPESFTPLSTPCTQPEI